MKLEDIKILVDWLGWDWDPNEVRDHAVVVRDTKTKVGPDWSPDIDHREFQTIFNTLDRGEWWKVVEKLPQQADWSFYGGISLLMNKLPILCQAVVEVIKEMKIAKVG